MPGYSLWMRSFCGNCFFTEPTITACACGGMWMLFCLPWFDALLSLPCMSAQEIVRWVLERKATDNDHDILSLYSCMMQHTGWQFFIILVHLSASVQRPSMKTLNLFQNYELLYLVFSDRERWLFSICLELEMLLWSNLPLILFTASWVMPFSFSRSVGNYV